MIILSSFGFRSPIVAQKMNSYIFCPEDKKVLIIPFAGFNSEDTGVRELGGLVSFGFCSKNIFILSPNNAEDAKKISFDYIYVPGGDTFKLLSELQKVVMACCCSKEDISLFVDCIISAVPSSVLCEIKNERVLSYE